MSDLILAYNQVPPRDVHPLNHLLVGFFLHFVVFPTYIKCKKTLGMRQSVVSILNGRFVHSKCIPCNYCYLSI